jgi:hypothetical protein
MKRARPSSHHDCNEHVVTLVSRSPRREAPKQIGFKIQENEEKYNFWYRREKPSDELPAAERKET